MNTTKTNRLFIASAILVAMLTTQAFKIEIPMPTPAGTFTAPAWADTIKNPLKGNLAAVADGKKTYTTFCVPCHGDKGRGDGVASASLAKAPADHSSAIVQKQTDGAIYWKLTEGNAPMPGYKSTLTVTQRWQLVDYIRTLAKTPKK